MNREHMVAGLEVNKRQDFTIKCVQGWELINTKFEHGNLVPGILEVVWGWWKWLLESGMGWKLISNGFASVTGCNIRIISKKQITCISNQGGGGLGQAGRAKSQ